MDGIKEMGNRWKIVHLTSVHNVYDPRILLKECRSLAKLGFEVVLIAPCPSPFALDNVQVKSIKVPHSRKQRLLLTLREIYKRAKEENADLYHIHDPELIPIACLLRSKGKPVVYDMHENLPKSILTKPYIPRLFRRALSACLKASESLLLQNMPIVFAEESYRKDYSFVKHFTTALNYPDAEGLEQIISNPNSQFSIGYIGAVTNSRGYTMTLRALEDLSYKGIAVNFHCVGSINQPSLQSSGEEANSRWANGRITMYGRMKSSDGLKIMARCHAGLALLQPAPNYVESYPTKIFEYMALGVPVICSNFPLYKSVVEAAKCGICVDPNDVNAISNAILYIKNHPEEAKEMGLRGRKAVQEKYQWSNEAIKISAFYKTILKRNEVAGAMFVTAP